MVSTDVSESKPSQEDVTDLPSQLDNAPIIEAVLDLDCDFEPTAKLELLEESARSALRASYPRFRKQVTHTHQVRNASDAAPEIFATQQLSAFIFHSPDDTQLVQLRTGGFSFNRLVPYTTLDDYLPEIARTWELYREVARPIQIRRIGLRFINRMLLPLENGRLRFNDYLKGLAELPEEDQRFHYRGFLNQHNAIEKQTGNFLKVTLATQPEENGTVPIILDLETEFQCSIEPSDWREALRHIATLRNLKNHIFRNMLTEKCLNLYR